MPRTTANLNNKGRRPTTQARGRVRQELLLQAARELLDEKPLDAISLADIAQRAGIPTGSAYHFFPSVHPLFQALVEQFADELDAAISAPYEINAQSDWSDILNQAIDRACVIYERSPAHRQLMISAKTPPEIKLADRVNDEQVGRLLMNAISRHFVLSDLPRATEIFFYAVEIIDLLFMLSMLREDRISEAMIVEAKRAAYAYLRTYLPSELPRRAITAN